MSEYKRVAPLSEQLGAQWGIPGEWIEPHLAAAEERGRQRGDAERDRLRRALREISAGSTKSGFEWGEVKRIADAALAPRDSGKDQP